MILSSAFFCYLTVLTGWSSVDSLQDAAIEPGKDPHARGASILFVGAKPPQDVVPGRQAANRKTSLTQLLIDPINPVFTLSTLILEVIDAGQ